MGVYMKALMKQIDEKNEEIVDILISLGMSRPIARVLSYLKKRNEVTSAELDRETGLRQPEVSIAAKELKERGWINEREEKKPGKGRPNKVYSLKVDFNKIISQIERQQRKAADEARSRIERLRKARRY
jgi:predicted transcriptional regulator